MTRAWVIASLLIPGLLAGGPASACDPWSKINSVQRENLIHRIKTNPDDYTIVIRHADKVPEDQFASAPDAFAAQTPAYCSGTTPPLTEIGVAQARAIGTNINAYGLNIGEVLTSPICRAHQTAAVAFGEDNVTLTVDEQLRFEDEKRRVSLRNRINDRTGNGLRVLVSHSLQIEYATDTTPACGEALILEKTKGTKQAQCKARILPDEWTASFGYKADNSLWTEPDQCASDALEVRAD